MKGLPLINTPLNCPALGPGFRMNPFVFILLLALVMAALPLRGANDGGEVVVVFNKRVPESLEIANYYARERLVPQSQLFGVDMSPSEEVTRAEFRDSLQKPLARFLVENKLWRIGSHVVPGTNGAQGVVEWRVTDSKIRYAVLCHGIPLKIAGDPTLKEDGSDKLRPEMRRDESAVDSELMLLPLSENKPPLSGPLRNPAYGTTNVASLHPTNGVLLVARLDGPTPAIAHRLVDLAKQAERDGLWGRAYFDSRSITDPGYKIGDDWINGAAEMSRRLGLEAVLDTNATTFPPAFPLSQVAYYLGWYDGNVSGPFAAPQVEFMPGAFAYHLHSFSAATLRSTNRNWAGPLLARGAAATMGAVNEPYLTGTPDLGVFTARLIFQGFTFGEAACASQSVASWQITVIGDPLYRPFGKNPDFLHAELTKRNSKLIEWSWLRLANLNLANGRPLADWVNNLELLDLTKTSAVLTEKLGDLYQAQGKPSSAVHACRQALKLDPSPMQRLRLLLTIAERLTSLDQHAEALEALQEVLKAQPNYPDKLGLCRKMLLSAQLAKNEPEIQKLEAEIKRLSPPPTLPVSPTNAPGR